MHLSALFTKGLFIASFGFATLLPLHAEICQNAPPLLDTTLNTMQASNPEADTIVRAAVDIGSGATKLKIAEINTSTHKITKILFNEQYAVPYQEHLEKSTDKNFDSTVMATGLASLKKSSEIAKKYGVQKVVAIATAAFRKAGNADEFIKEIEKETGIKVYVIDQELEGKLAFQAATNLVNTPAENILVWDIGGGSLQLTMLNAEGSYQIYRGHDASVPFKNRIIQQIQGRDLGHHHSPNPMTAGEISQSVSEASRIAEKVDRIFKDKIYDPETQVIGVGSVFANGLVPLMHHRTTFSLVDLAFMVSHLAGKTDSDMGGGDFSNVSVSNAILVLGFMQELGIKKLMIFDVNNADGAFLYQPFWESK